MAGNYGIPMGAMSGFIGGDQARIDNDTQLFNQQKTLQDIAQMQQNMSIAQQKLPGELEHQKAQTGMLGAQTGLYNTQNENAQSEERRRVSKEFVEHVIQQGMVPGAVERFAQERKIPLDAPLVQAVKRAQKEDAEWQSAPGETHPQRLKQLLETLAASDSQSRQRTADAEAAHKRTMAQQAEMTARNRETLESRERQTATMAQAKIKAKELEQMAQKYPSLQQVAGYYIMQADAAERTGDLKKAEEIRANAENVLNQIKEIELIRDEKKRASRAEELYTITGGKIDIRRPAAAPTTAPAAAPKPAPAAPGKVDPRIQKALGANFDPNKTYEVDPDGTIYEVRPKQ